MKFKEVTASDVELQKELLLVALWTPDDEPDHDPKVLELAHIKAYFEEWGRAGDLGLFALNQFDEQLASSRFDINRAKPSNMLIILNWQWRFMPVIAAKASLLHS